MTQADNLLVLKYFTIHMIKWMCKRGNQPKTVNFDYMHDKLDVEMSKVHPTYLIFLVYLGKCLWKRGNPP